MSAPVGDIQALAAMAAHATPPSARVVAREFEALLLSEVMRGAARPLLPGSDPLDGGSTGRMYREQFFAEVARLAARAGSFGLAPVLERQIDAGSPDAAHDGGPE